jgi:hypothetical protein
MRCPDDRGHRQRVRRSLTWPLSNVTLADVEARFVGAAGGGWPLVEVGLRSAVIVLAAEQVGICPSALIGQCLIPRPGLPQDVVGLAAFLASDDAAYIWPASRPSTTFSSTGPQHFFIQAAQR